MLTPEVLKAAERLRRVDRGEDPITVYYLSYGYSGFDESSRRMAEDRKTLADFALRILPAGERPEQLRDKGDVERPRGWRVANGKAWEDCCCDNCFAAITGVERYETEAAAREALHHQLLEQIAALTNHQPQGDR